MGKPHGLSTVCLKLLCILPCVCCCAEPRTLSEHGSVFPGQRQPRMREDCPCPRGPIFLSRGKDNNHVLGVSSMVVYTDRGGWGLWWRGGLEVQIPVSKSILQGRKDIYNIIIHTAKAGLSTPWATEGRQLWGRSCKCVEINKS